MPDLHGWIIEKITAAENTVRAAEKEHGRDWTTRWVQRGDYFEVTDDLGLLVADQVQPSTAGLIAANDPQAILRRCAADRKLLTLHGPRGTDWNSSERERCDPYVCEGCGQEGICQDWVTEHANDCPVLLAVAEGYGLTEEILAELDRPQWTPPPPAGQSALGKAIAEAWGAALKASLRVSLQQDLVLSTEAAPTPAEKALHVLGPALATIPLYQPTGETGAEPPTK
ncbi:MAG TPA: DUF6221 family protein [Streptomyces sp.]|nr:DUF6221 family protein [Streptomyces sp.]